MPKLTDDQLGDLLRETFADHATDSLPAATKRRHLAPILIAAAAVLAVLGGVVYGVQRTDEQPPVATSTPSTVHLSDTAVWAMAIRRIAQEHEPAGGWKAVRLYQPGPRHSTLQPDTSTGRAHTENAQVIVPVAAQRQQIAQFLDDLPSVQWAEGNPSVCPKDIAQIIVLPIVQDGSGRLVKVSITYGCTTSDSYSVKVV
ncbi:hypothetical protein GCM10009745_19000 [Kribbella yunnanensis]|uniref:Uncharacterized protein n=1 Tax=Kribbella yunnanensis TaxID=190194 RepID=A0ABP4SUX6_9ACTN